MGRQLVPVQHDFDRANGLTRMSTTLVSVFVSSLKLRVRARTAGKAGDDFGIAGLDHQHRWVTAGGINSLVTIEEFRLCQGVCCVTSGIDLIAGCNHLRGRSHLASSRAVASDCSVVNANHGAFDVALDHFKALPSWFDVRPVVNPDRLRLSCFPMRSDYIITAVCSVVRFHPLGCTCG